MRGERPEAVGVIGVDERCEIIVGDGAVLHVAFHDRVAEPHIFKIALSERFGFGKSVGCAGSYDVGYAVERIQFAESGCHLIGVEVLTFGVVVSEGARGGLCGADGFIVICAESVENIVSDLCGVDISAVLADFRHGVPAECGCRVVGVDRESYVFRRKRCVNTAPDGFIFDHFSGDVAQIGYA